MLSEIGFSGTARFELVRQLGVGGMGVVYEAIDRERQARVALKALHQLEPHHLLRLKQEFRSLQGIAHPNLVNLLELVNDEGHWFITMELVDGRPFIQHVGGGGEDATVDDRPRAFDTLPDRPRGSPVALDEARLRTSMRQLVEAVDALHRAGKIHRDLKPSNVLVTPEGRVVVLDFGLVTDSSGSDRSRASQIVGTVAYMAPEQAAAQPLDEAADWYAVGVMLYEALTGHLPISGTPLEILQRKQHEEPRPPAALVHCSPQLSSLSADLLRIDPRKRPRAHQILRELGDTEAAERTWSNRSQPSFVGRKAELARLDAAYQAMRGGRPSAVLVEGPSGVGKSALVRHFADGVRAKTPELVVLAGRYYERETVPYRALDAILDEVSRFLVRLPPDQADAYLPVDAPLLGVLFPSLRAVSSVSKSGLKLPAHDPHELRGRLLRAVRELFVRLSQRRPLILIIDDIQWADPDSQAVLGEAVRGPEGPALLLLATLRSAPDLDSSTGTASIEPIGTLERVMLDRLPHDEACTLATRLLGGDGAQAESIAVEAEGHPLFIDALVRHALFLGETRSGPLRLEEALDELIRGLEEPARLALELVALTNGPLTYDLLLRAASFDYGALTRVAAALKAVHLARGARRREQDALEPFHGRIRERVLATLDETTRRARHEQLARAIESLDSADSEAQLVHWRGAGDRARAAHHAAAAAQKANDALAFDAAARLYREAIALSDEKRRSWAGLGEALANGGRGPEAADAFAHAVEGAPPQEALDLRRKIAEQLLRSGLIEEGLSAVRDVLAQVGLGMPKTPRRALAAFVWNRARVELRGTKYRERPEVEVATADLVRIDACWSVAGVLGMVDTIRGAYFQTLHLRLALDAGEPFRVARALALEAAFCAVPGTLSAKRTARFVAQAEALAARVGDPYVIGWVRGAAGSAAALEGRWREGQRLCREAEETFRNRCGGIAWELSTFQFFHIYSLAYTGQMRALRACVEENLQAAEERGDRYAAGVHRLALSNMAWLATDEVAAARERVKNAMRPWMEGPFRLAHFWEMLAECQTDLYEGDAARAQERIDRHWPGVKGSLLLRVQLTRIEADHLRGRVLLAAAVKSADRRPLLAGARRHARAMVREKTPWGTPLAELLLAGAAALDGELDEAAARLRTAASGLDAAAMRLYAEAARWRLGKLIGGDEGRVLLDGANAWMASEGIVTPAHMVRMLAPGFQVAS